MARIRVEQAIGVLAERHRIQPRQAFEQLRNAARSRGRRVIDIASDVVASATNPLLQLPDELSRPRTGNRHGPPDPRRPWQRGPSQIDRGGRRGDRPPGLVPRHGCRRVTQGLNVDDGESRPPADHRRRRGQVLRHQPGGTTRRTPAASGCSSDSPSCAAGQGTDRGGHHGDRAPGQVLAEYQQVFSKLGVEMSASCRSAAAPTPTARSRGSAGRRHRHLLQRRRPVQAADPGRLEGQRSAGQRLADGLVVAGTSAGATALGRTMILGGNGAEVSTATVRTGPGLGLMPKMLIDMHFGERGRLPQAAQRRHARP